MVLIWKHLSRTFPQIKDHVLLIRTKELQKAKGIILDVETQDFVEDLVSIIPKDWLVGQDSDMNPEDKRDAYQRYILSRIDSIDLLIKEVNDVR